MFTFEQAKKFMEEELHAEQEVAKARRLEAEERLAVAGFQSRLERLQTRAAARAYLEGKIDGKNEKQREIQLATLLEEDKLIQQAENDVKSAQETLIIRQATLALCEADLHYRQHLSLVAAGLVEE